ncbi:hypothetical protein EON66_01975, partial [archaeon]
MTAVAISVAFAASLCAPAVGALTYSGTLALNDGAVLPRSFAVDSQRAFALTASERCVHKVLLDSFTSVARTCVTDFTFVGADLFVQAPISLNSRDGIAYVDVVRSPGARVDWASMDVTWLLPAGDGLQLTYFALLDAHHEDVYLVESGWLHRKRHLPSGEEAPVNEGRYGLFDEGHDNAILWWLYADPDSSQRWLSLSRYRRGEWSPVARTARGYDGGATCYAWDEPHQLLYSCEKPGLVKTNVSTLQIVTTLP